MILRGTAALIVALTLASCANQPKTPTAVTDTISVIHDGIVTYCEYSVTRGIIEALLNTFVPGASLVSDVIGAVCGAVAPMASAGPKTRSMVVPKVNGIPLKGCFVSNPKCR